MKQFCNARECGYKSCCTKGVPPWTVAPARKFIFPDGPVPAWVLLLLACSQAEGYFTSYFLRERF
jgi:hypothetical protein